MDKLIVFDIAGTTIQDDNAVNKAFLQAFQQFSLSPTSEQIDQVMGLAKPFAIKKILKELKDTTPVTEIHDQFLKNMIGHYSLDENVKEITGASETFEAMHKEGYKVALDTGFSRDITNLIIDKMDWVNKGLVDAVISSDQVQYGRPYPYMIFKLMETLNIQSVHDVVKVGDTVADICEGLNAGCETVIGVTSGSDTFETLRALQSQVLRQFLVVPSVADVPAILHYTPI